MDHYKKMMEEMEEPGDIKACIKVKIKIKNHSFKRCCSVWKEKAKKTKYTVVITSSV